MLIYLIFTEYHMWGKWLPIRYLHMVSLDEPTANYVVQRYTNDDSCKVFTRELWIKPEELREDLHYAELA